MKKFLKSRRPLILVTVVSVFLLVILSFKYLALKVQWIAYSGWAQTNVLQRTNQSTQEEAYILAQTATSSFGGVPLYRTGKSFQSYISGMGNFLSRSIVVVDRNRTILADTTSANVSKKYMQDKNDEVQKTMSDKMPRTYLESMGDLQKDVNQLVVPLTDQTGGVVGALVLSIDSVAK